MNYAEHARARLGELRRQLDDKAAGRDPGAGIPTGLRELDRRGGVKRGVLTLVGANTGEGKDIFALQLMTAAAKSGYPTEVISMEDPPERTVDRSFSTITGLNNAALYALAVDEKEMVRVALAAAEIDEWGELIEYHDGLMDAKDAVGVLDASTAELRIFNYLQALPGELERTIADVCWNLNAIAQRDNCAMVAFSQVNTVKVEERGLRILERSMGRDKSSPDVSGFRPFGASDLAWCSAAGQRAKDLKFLFRANRYLKRAGINVKDDRMEISSVKSNFGAEGRVVVGFDGKTARLFDLQESE